MLAVNCVVEPKTRVKGAQGKIISSSLGPRRDNQINKNSLHGAI